MFMFVVPAVLMRIERIRYTRYSLWKRNLCHNSLPCQIPSVSSEELAFPRLIRCELSRLRCHGHSLLLTSYLCRIKRKQNSSCNACRHPLQDLTHLLLIVLHLSLSGAPFLALFLPFLTSGPDLGARPDCWVSVKFLHAPIPRRGQVAPPPGLKDIAVDSETIPVCRWLDDDRPFI